MFLLTGLAAAQVAPSRPPITGLSHAGYYVSDLGKAMNFWHGLLGYDVYWELKTGSGATRIAFVKINDHQHIELFNEANPHSPNWMSHLCFTTSDARGMLAYLKANGVQGPEQAGLTKAGDLAFEVKDPDGTLVEFVEPQKNGQETLAAGKFESAKRISDSIYHIGFSVGNTQKSLDFYEKLLGFTETWRGSPSVTELSWINLRVPDGTDYIELMLGAKPPADANVFGTKNHTALAVPDIYAAEKILKSRAEATGYGKPLEVRTGVNRKRQLNLYDPDGTRVELMETQTIDGKPTPPSTAPPPAPWHP
jgi:catechol 2,3-dioxygenase-like lactoylglutathione lyase family enzyme